MADVLAPDFLLSGRYRILGLAGTGGMGAVYKATDTHLGGRTVALKEMREQGLSPQEIAEATDAFQHEAHLLANLHHSSLPSIHDHFQADGRWYLVMDFIDGETLEEYLRHNGTPGLPVAAVLRIADQLCAVLEYLHRQTPPIIFRDLKPGNIMITASSHLYLIDFGIARLFKPGQEHDTISLGSPGYAAPEQYGKSQTTGRSDIYSLGATLHQLLTGLDPELKPFAFSPIRPWNPQTPPRLEALIMAMVQLNESKRPPSVAWVRQELRHIASQTSTTQKPPAPPGQPVAPPPVQSVPASYAPPSPVFTGYPSTRVSKRGSGCSVLIFAILGASLAVVCIVALICSAASGAVQDLAQSGSGASTQSESTADAQGTLRANQSTLSSDESTLSYDVAGLAQVTNFTYDLAAYGRTWNQMQKDYQQELSDYQQGCGPSGSTETVTLSARTISMDLNSIRYDDNGLAYSAKLLNNNVQKVESDIATIQLDLQALKHDAAGSNSATAVASSVGIANTALANAQHQVIASNKALQSAQTQAMQYDQEASETNTAAQNLAKNLHC